MAFIPYSSDSKSQVSISVDKYGRIQLSAGLRRKLKCENEEIQLYLSFEPETRRIGLERERKGKDRPYKFDKNRGYTSAVDFLKDFDIAYDEGTTRYYYDGMVNGVMAFKASREYNGENATRFVQQKNGYLEKIV